MSMQKPVTHYPYTSDATPEDGFATARLLYMRGVYTAEQMERHMDEAIDRPIFGILCPHRISPNNCRHCCGREAEYWMGP